CIDDPIVLVAVARLLERGGRAGKARRRFERALALNPLLGDAYVHLYALEVKSNFSTQLLGVGGGSAGGAGAGAVGGEGGIDGLDDEEDEGEETAEPGVGVGDAGAGGLPPMPAALVLLEARINKAEPTQGEEWLSHAKETKLRRMPRGLLLRVVVEGMLGVKLSALMDTDPTPAPASV
ncbi:hypothetical protein B484DRAFT_401654, partial [Ochromonadaceae sp. CCMP2298]